MHLWLKQNSICGIEGKIMGQTEEPTRVFALSLVVGLLVVCNAVAVGVAGPGFFGFFLPFQV